MKISIKAQRKLNVVGIHTIQTQTRVKMKLNPLRFANYMYTMLPTPVNLTKLKILSSPT